MPGRLDPVLRLRCGRKLPPLRSGCLRPFISRFPHFLISIPGHFLISFLIAASASAAPSVVSVENGGLLFTDNQAGVSGTDAGFSSPIGDKTLWIFGDVFLLDPKRPEKPYIGNVSNCGLLVPNGKGTAPLKRYKFLTEPAAGLARQLIPLESGEKDDTRLWPGGSWYDAAEKRLYLFYSGISILGEGTYNFRCNGWGLCVADVSKPEDIRFDRLKSGRPSTPVVPSSAQDASSWMWPSLDGKAVYGNATLDGGEWLYVYGARDTKPGSAARLARVRKSKVSEINAYEYFCGTPDAPKWSWEQENAVDLAGLKDFPSELTVANNRYLGGYLAVHTVILDDRIRLSLAPNPWGPFTKIAEIGAPRQAFTKSPCYAGKEHPELAEDGGRVVYITYVDQQRYWLQLLKVTLKR